MAILTNMQQNILSRIQKLAKQEVASKDEATQLIGMWGNEFAVMPTTETIQQYAPFAHVTAQEVIDGASALVSINAERGEYDTPTSNIVKLLRIVNGS